MIIFLTFEVQVSFFVFYVKSDFFSLVSGKNRGQIQKNLRFFKKFLQKSIMTLNLGYHFCPIYIEGV